MRNTFAVISHNAITNNVNTVRSHLDSKTKLCTVIKANAYGHGIVELGAFLQRNLLADYFGVAIADEGIALRKSGITLPILVLGAMDKSYTQGIVEFNLSPTVFSNDDLLALQREAELQSKHIGVHVKVDSGMHRIGVRSLEAFASLLETLKRCPNLYMQGIFTHFAVSEISDPAYTDNQARVFLQFVQMAKAMGHNPLVHCCNSGAIFQHPKYQFDMVRLGISLYGYHPNSALTSASDLSPVLSWMSEVADVFELNEGQSLSYGLTYTAKAPNLIAVIPVGYGDGYKRCLSNKAEVLIGGRRCKQVGTVCMDQMMCDISSVPNVRKGDPVVLIGSQGEEAITADDMAKWANTISYEILLSISDRVPRIYVD